MNRLVADAVNDKATLASQVKIFLTLVCSERNVCMHRYVHASAYGGMVKTSLSNVVWGFAFINCGHSVQGGAVSLGGDTRQCDAEKLVRDEPSLEH